jgi:hypothetical protein
MDSARYEVSRGTSASRHSGSRVGGWLGRQRLLAPPIKPLTRRSLGQPPNIGSYRDAKSAEAAVEELPLHDLCRRMDAVPDPEQPGRHE